MRKSRSRSRSSSVSLSESSNASSDRVEESKFDSDLWVNTPKIMFGGGGILHTNKKFNLKIFTPIASRTRIKLKNLNKNKT